MCVCMECVPEQFLLHTMILEQSTEVKERVTIPVLVLVH